VGPIPSGTKTLAEGEGAAVIREWLWEATTRALVLIMPLLWASVNVNVLSAQGTRRQIAVEVGDNYYQPAVVRVKAGDLIVFTNIGKQLHSLTLIDHEQLLDAAYLDTGKTFTFTVSTGLQPGPYVLGCNIHVDMQGRIVIEP
jgi:plastocyanin